jgi:hypothetical protein
MTMKNVTFLTHTQKFQLALYVSKRKNLNMVGEIASNRLLNPIKR